MSLNASHVEADGTLVLVYARRTALTGRQALAVTTMIRHSHRAYGGHQWNAAHTADVFAWRVECVSPVAATEYATALAASTRA